MYFPIIELSVVHFIKVLFGSEFIIMDWTASQQVVWDYDICSSIIRPTYKSKKNYNPENLRITRLVVLDRLITSWTAYVLPVYPSP